MRKRYSEGRFVHIVGLADLNKRTGKISYVNPTTSAIERDPVAQSRLQLEVYDEKEKLLSVHNAELRRSSCAPRGVEHGLIQEDLPYEAGMKSIRLKIDGEVVDTYVAGVAAPPGGLSLAPSATAGAVNRMAVRAPAGTEPQRGVTYTIQVQAENASNWQTVAVGKPTPDVDVDVNQFPNSRHLVVRVLRTDGLSSDEVMRRDIHLGDTE